MNTSTDQRAQQREIAMRQVEDLQPGWWRDALVTLAVLEHARSHADWHAAALAAGVRDARGQRPSEADFLALTRAMLAARLVRKVQGWLVLSPLISELVARQAAREGRYGAVRAALDRRQPWVWDDGKDTAGNTVAVDMMSALARARHALYEKRFVRANAILDSIASRRRREWLAEGRAAAFLTNPFDPAWLAPLNERLRSEIVRGAMLRAAVEADPAPAAVAWLRERIGAGEDPCGLYSLSLGEHLLLRGDVEGARTLAAAVHTPGSRAIQGCLHALDGRLGDAHAAFAEAAEEARRTDRRQRLHDGLGGVLWCAVLLRMGTAESLAWLGALAAEHRKLVGLLAPPWAKAFDIAYGTLGPDSDRSQMHFIVTPAMVPQLPDHQKLPESCAGCWAGGPGIAAYAEPLRALAEQYARGGWTLMAAEALRLAGHVTSDRKLLKRAEQLRGSPEGFWIVESHVRKEPWELALEKLARLQPAGSSQGGDGPSRDTRHVWLLHRDSRDRGIRRIELLEQTLMRNGRWSAGRRLETWRYGVMDDERHLAGLEERDKQAMRALARCSGSYYSDERGGSLAECLAELAGHPLVFWADERATPIEICLRQPAVHVVRRGETLKLILAPVPGEQQCVYEITGAHQITVSRFSPAQLQVAKVIGDGIEVPVAAEQRLTAALAAIAGTIPLESDAVAGLKLQPGDPRPVVRLFEDNGVVRVSLHCRPAPGGALAIPGKGRRVLVTVEAGAHTGYERDLSRERALAAPVAVLIDEWLEPGADGYQAPDPASQLEFLLALGRLGDSVIIEWARGAPVRIRAEADLEMFRGSVRRADEWFEIDGALAVDENLVLQLAPVLELLRTGAAGRFVRLESGEYLALTERLRRRLDDLAAAGEAHGRAVRIAPAAALWAGEAVEALAGDRCPEWTALAERIRDAISSPALLPAGFQGELREYQLEGFQWLYRLSCAGLGACLADDMGLGKTVQALALLLARAPLGPALVVAPTSVCAGWLTESLRFAPSLKVRELGHGDRVTLIAQAGAGDIVVASYGLLIQEEELLCSREWATVILDEAQAIKNLQTRRARAAMRLNAGSRVAMSGTPIENHLGELWTIMQFLNPGLLGSAQRFAQLYLETSAPDDARERRKRLRRVISPFVLRRTKSQVLEELPGKTEVVVEVELGPEEAAFYEALRRRSLTELADVQADPEHGRMRILAAITRLRRACCNPRVVEPSIAVPSAKLEAFEEKTQELIDNGHRALVFSQFVDHLNLLREALDRSKVTYQYLDGSTPAAERTRAVNAFQRGADPLFLISLRAGGFGLNLTAADYVFIMDPWWNPAVEDQAADRAHRIGQQRPVTIYRFVAKGTIEEKIIALHREKRDLAESVLDGADRAGKITAEELLGLLREAGE